VADQHRVRPDARSPSGGRELRTGRPHPPYDVEKTGEDAYRITLAIAGFAPDELTVTAPPDASIPSRRCLAYHPVAAWRALG